MADMTPEEYKADGGQHCPVCKGCDISGGQVEVDAGIAAQEVDCHQCGASWVDTYVLTGYTGLEQPE